MKKRKIVGICFILIFLVSIANVHANYYKINQKERIPLGNGDNCRYSSVIETENGSDLAGVRLTPWYCWTATFGRRVTYEGIKLFGARTGDICFGTGEDDEHQLLSFWNHTVYFDDGVVEFHQCDPLYLNWSREVISMPIFQHVKSTTNPHLYTITKIEVHEDKYVDGEYYEYSGTIRASSCQMN